MHVRVGMVETHTSRGYIRAQEVTPEREPQTKGTSEACMGSHDGVGPCSPDDVRPKRCRMPSYSRKYKAVPAVSLTVLDVGVKCIDEATALVPKWSRNPA